MCNWYLAMTESIAKEQSVQEDYQVTEGESTQIAAQVLQGYYSAGNKVLQQDESRIESWSSLVGNKDYPNAAQEVTSWEEQFSEDQSKMQSATSQGNSLVQTDQQATQQIGTDQQNLATLQQAVNQSMSQLNSMLSTITA